MSAGESDREHRRVTVAQVAAARRLDAAPSRRRLGPGRRLGTHLEASAGARVRQADLEALLGARAPRRGRAGG